MHRSNQELSQPQIDGGYKVYTVQGERFEVPQRYRLLRVLGKGAYGIVCSALDMRTGIKCAIKKCKNLFVDPTDLDPAAFAIREVEVMRFCRHENILGLHTVLPSRKPKGEIDELYLVMDLHDIDMSTLIRSKHVIQPEHARQFMYQLMCGLCNIHSAKLIHGDLKPSNLVIDLDGVLVIIDFGMTQHMSGPLLDYIVTYQYRAPELLVGNPVYGPAVDMWAAGCIFAELYNRKIFFPFSKTNAERLASVVHVLGRPPEDIVQNSALLYRIHSSPKAAGTTLEKTVPSMAADTVALDFLKKLLTVDPRLRPTAAEMLQHPYLAAFQDPGTAHVARGACPCVPIRTLAEAREGLWEILQFYNPKEHPTPVGILVVQMVKHVKELQAKERIQSCGGSGSKSCLRKKQQVQWRKQERGYFFRCRK